MALRGCAGLNWLIAGTDAHAKNYSLLLAGSQVRLAPLYDVASVLPYDIDVMGQKLAMKVGGEYRLKVIAARNWRKVASELKLDESQLMDRLRGLAERLPDAVRDVSRTPDVSDLGSPLPARLVDGVAARCAWYAAWL